MFLLSANRQMVEETPELIDDSFKLNVDLFGNSTLDLLVLDCNAGVSSNVVP